VFVGEYDYCLIFHVPTQADSGTAYQDLCDEEGKPGSPGNRTALVRLGRQDSTPKHHMK